MCAQLERKGGWIPHQALPAHSKRPSVPQTKETDSTLNQEPPPVRPIDFPSGGRNLTVPQHKFNTSATLTSLLVHIGLHDHHLLPVPISPASSDFSGPNSEKPPWPRRPPSCLPSGGSAERFRSGRVGFLPHSRAWLGAARLEPGNPGRASLRLGARCLSLQLAAVPGGTERLHGSSQGIRRADKPRRAPASPRSPAPAPRPARRAPARTALAPASRGGGTAGGIRAGARRDGAHDPPSRPLPQTRTPAPTRHGRMPQGPPSRLGGEERQASGQLTSHPGPDKGYELLGPARSRACVRRSGARLAGLSQPRNYESQKPLGAARLFFSAGGSTRGAAGRLEGAVVSFPLARVSGRYARVGFSPGRARTPRDGAASAGTRALSPRGTAAQCLGPLRTSTLTTQPSDYMRACGFPRIFVLPNSSFAFKQCERCILGNSGLCPQTAVRASIDGL